MEVSRLDLSNVPPGFTISNPTELLVGFGVGAERKLHPRFALGLVFDVRPESYVVVDTVKVLRVVNVPTPELGLSSRWIFIPPQPFGISLETKAEVLFPKEGAEFQTEMGTALSAKLKFEEQRPTKRLGLGVYYMEKHYGSNIESVSRGEFGLDFDIRFTFGN